MKQAGKNIARWLAAAGILSLIALPAFGETNRIGETGHELVKRCTTGSPFEKGMCLGYILSISDVMSNNPIGEFRACVPPKLSDKDVRDKVWHWLDQHPDKLKFTADSLVALALSEIYPCT